MTEQAILQLAAVVIGGLLATGGGIVTTLIIESRRRTHDAAQLALAFKGEIRALIQHVDERNYLDRISQVIDQIEASGQPFYMPIRVRFEYDRVYEHNVERIGLLKAPLPARIPLFYTRLNSLFEDFLNLAEGAYTSLDLPTLLRVYRDLHRIMELTVQEGAGIIEVIEAHYPH